MCNTGLWPEYCSAAGSEHQLLKLTEFGQDQCPGVPDVAMGALKRHHCGPRYRTSAATAFRGGRPTCGKVCRLPSCVVCLEGVRCTLRLQAVSECAGSRFVDRLLIQALIQTVVTSSISCKRYGVCQMRVGSVHRDRPTACWLFRPD